MVGVATSPQDTEMSLKIVSFSRAYEAVQPIQTKRQDKAAQENSNPSL